MFSIFKIARRPVKAFAAPRRFLSQDLCPSERQKDWKFRLRKIAFNMTGYNKYGLYTDDVMNSSCSTVHEALRRIPKDVLDARNFRIIRALQLDFLRIYLPKEKWITYEEDVEYRYLSPYIEEIKAERLEIYNFGCVNYTEYDWPLHEVR